MQSAMNGVASRCRSLSHVRCNIYAASSLQAVACIEQYVQHHSSRHTFHSPASNSNSKRIGCATFDPSVFRLRELHDRHFSAAGQSSTDQGNRRASLKDFMQYASKISAAVDVGYVSRLLASLNVELPRNFTDLRHLLPSVTSTSQATQLPKIQQERATSPVPKDVVTAVNSNKSMKTETSEEVKVNSDVKSKTMKGIKHSADREQHEFVHAMNAAQESVSSFHQTAEKSLSVQSLVQKTSESVEFKKGSLLQSALVNDMSETVKTMASDLAKQISSYMPSAASEKFRPTSAVAGPAQAVPVAAGSVKEAKVLVAKKTTVQRRLIARSSIDRQTRGLVLCLREAKTAMSQVVRLDELIRHVMQYPECTGVAVKTKAIPCLLRLRGSRNTEVSERCRQLLAMMGYVDPVRGRGVNVLCLDGGGTKGLVTIGILKRLEELSHRRLHELFDYVCGVSTGALIGIMAAAFRVPCYEMEEIYKEFSVQMFSQNRIVGAGKLFMSHAYYDTELWERILKENVGEKSFLDTARDKNCPKLSSVSTLVNIQRIQNFLFRNYNLPPTRHSHYLGSSEHLLREAVRASSAAPGYYEEYHLGDWVHQDGGLLTNNPTAIAIHECRQLWPDTPIQCVVSIGTGRYEPASSESSNESTNTTSKASSLKKKVTKIVESATDTEAVHTVLFDLLPASSYYRFNPYMSEEFLLDEIRLAKWDQMKQDTEMYCRKNEPQLENAVRRLLQPKLPHTRLIDWLKTNVDKIG